MEVAAEWQRQGAQALVRAVLRDPKFPAQTATFLYRWEEELLFLHGVHVDLVSNQEQEERLGQNSRRLSRRAKAGEPDRTTGVYPEPAGNLLGQPVDAVEISISHLRGGYPWIRWEGAARTAAWELASGSPGLANEAVSPSTLLRKERRGRATDLLVQVAREYRTNVKRGLHDPVSQIARDHGVKPATARAWVFRARDLGLLGPARGPTAGEAVPGPD